MKETFDELFGFLHGIKTHVIDTNNLSLMWSYTQIEKRVKRLQDKYNESMKQESLTSTNTEMTALEYLKEKARMTDNCKIECKRCPLYAAKHGEYCTCSIFQLACPEKVISIVQQWSKEHPQKTIKDDFFEKFPNAKKLCDGVPDVCAAKLGYLPECPHPNAEDYCNECWNTVLKEK